VTPEEFCNQLLTNDIEDVVDNVLLGGEAIHFNADQQRQVSRAVCSKFGVDEADLDLRIVGSAKLGFSISEKRKNGGTSLPRFRLFSPESDVDIAIVSERVFESIWDELSRHAYRKPWMPWDSGKLGDYMIYGWLRPDHFPKNVRLRRCDDWRDLFSRLSADSRFGRRAIRGALYHSLEHLRRYQLRGLSECRSALEAAV
jgi:hypothetical protein